MESELNSQSLAFVEQLYQVYQRNPESVPTDWQQYFRGLSNGNGHGSMVQLGPSFHHQSVFNPGPTHPSHANGKALAEYVHLQDKVDQLIRAYRVRGHMMADIDPLDQERAPQPELMPEYYGLTERDMEKSFSANTITGAEKLTLGRIIEIMRNTYCRSIGVQFMHIDDISVRNWLMERMEGSENRLELSRSQQLGILTRLTDAIIFEEFLQKKFMGAKSFSLEGGESLIPLLDLTIEKSAEQKIDEIVFAMAHRGRLNVLANIMGKSPRKIFHEFMDPDPALNLGRGDVKYHLGYRNDWLSTSGHSIHLSLCFNPSHLEFVNPVALGRTRAKQDRSGDLNRERKMCLMIHGDAAFVGEGVTQEILNLSQLAGYRTGGSLHVILNNQLGFTTNPSEGRSCTYATDIAKMLQIPIFHVNGEDPEAVAMCVNLAMDFRKTFQRDVVIDMYCYRRRGHNEGDEPSFTQPVMYRNIAERASVREGYLERMLKLGKVSQEEADEISIKRRQHLEAELSFVKTKDYTPRADKSIGVWSPYLGGPDSAVPDVDTGVDEERLSKLLHKLNQLPQDFNPHPKVVKLLEIRNEMADANRPLDWATAEILALGTLATEGHRVRLSGQDCGRGTFSQRHAELHDYQDGHRYIPLQHLQSGQAPVEVINSPLSEVGVLGFEYGYSHDAPGGLVLWEAQFGDFCNVAQVIIDQFIASAEDKWGRLSGLVLLLPHSFEGMGPEHSSARLERFLTLVAQDNMQVCYPTTPAQHYHLLRRQIYRPWRKPLIVMTPKSLLRHPEAVSPLREFSKGKFKRILPDESGTPSDGVKRVLLCSGKVYYELAARRKDMGKEADVHILRLEQLYPLKKTLLSKMLKPYAEETPVYWVQEEPENMGAWRYLLVKFGRKLLDRFPFHGIYRHESASPATGSASSHRYEQNLLLDQAFRGL